MNTATYARAFFWDLMRVVLISGTVGLLIGLGSAWAGYNLF